MSNFNEMVSEFVNANSTVKYPRGMRAKTSVIDEASFISALKEEDNWGHTANGAVGKKSTGSKLYDLFAMGTAYRQRTESDCILLFKEAYLESPEYALKCLAYLRDIESQGQGERRFFRVVLKWLASFDEKAVKRNLEYLVKNNYCRWDDIFVLFDTNLEDFVMDIIRKQLTEDITNYNKGTNVPISLCAKWLKSCNCSSEKSKHEGRKIASALKLTEREYRKMLSRLRERIKVVERLMSQNRWNEIQFDKLPSRAGLIYRNCFKNKGLIAEKYREFAKDTTTKVNAGKLYPYDVAAKAIALMGSDGYYYKYVALDDTERLMINKYWNNLEDYFKDAISNLMVVCDTSGSMRWSGRGVAPITVATSLAVYAAEHANGPFANHYISFSRTARLVEVKGVDFCDKIDRITRANLCENTDLESVFDLVLNTAMSYHLAPSQIPSTLIVITDMQVDAASNSRDKTTFMESMRRKWYQKCGGKYEFPSLVLWNVNAAVSNTNIIDDSKTGVTFVSGCSPTIFKQVLTGVTGETLMYQTLDGERYKNIH